jgi:hypothetical protein
VKKKNSGLSSSPVCCLLISFSRSLDAFSALLLVLLPRKILQREPSMGGAGAAVPSQGLACAPPAAVILNPRTRRASPGSGGHRSSPQQPLRSDLPPTPTVACRARSRSSSSSNVVSAEFPFLWVSFSSCSDSSPGPFLRTLGEGMMRTSCSRICSNSTARWCTAPVDLRLPPLRPTRMPSACPVCASPFSLFPSAPQDSSHTTNQACLEKFFLSHTLKQFCNKGVFSARTFFVLTMY